MKALKITCALVAVALLAVSVVNSDTVVPTDDAPTYKTYSPKDLLATDKKKKILETHA
ncbi:hypothetical protein [Winogradskyella arenosi]|uniref:Uncharacterized protein n=1 Tax=Winogradskyella arenosi TaxID=533325 RepID=A0A368ZM00_9FLAO|nr:hypothetical protein [Winogradskyella arenosi]RCW93905.1 hypothetical protein DFQ08_101705 [Winogradskyella arenosi]